ncbi:MAG: hypothetical protein ACMVO5_09735 [Polymorphobacter sp.]
MDSGDVRRGVCRWLMRAGVAPLAEATLGCGRRLTFWVWMRRGG